MPGRSNEIDQTKTGSLNYNMLVSCGKQGGSLREKKLSYKQLYTNHDSKNCFIGCIGCCAEEKNIQKVSGILHQPTFRAAPPMCLLCIWKGGQGQHRVIILKIKSHIFGKAITDCCLATGMFSTSLGKSWNW